MIPAPTPPPLSYSGAGLAVNSGVVPSYTLSATIASTVPVIGTVNFYAGTTRLGTSAINNKGVATLILYDSNPIPAVPPFVASQPTAAGFVVQNPTFTATYTGGANFTSSTSPGVSVPGDMGVVPLTSVLAASQGAVSDTFLVVTLFLGLNGTVSFSCTGLSANTLCRFLPGTLVFPQPMPTYTTIDNLLLNFGLPNYYLNGGAAPFQVQVYTNVPTTLAKAYPEIQPGMRNQRQIVEATTPMLAAMMLLGLWKRKNPMMTKLLLVILAVSGTVFSSLWMSG